MKKWWKRSKNRILSLSLALMIGVASVLPSMNVEASETDSEVEDLIQKEVFVDKNEDGQIQFGEVNPLKLVFSSFSRLGYWFAWGKESVLNMVEYYQSWLQTGQDEILGWLGEDGLLYLNDDTWQLIRKFANALTLNEGYTIYPALNPSKLYWSDAIGVSLDDSLYNSYVGSSLNFVTGTPIAIHGETLYITNVNQGYFDRVLDNSLVLIKSGSTIACYYFEGVSLRSIYVTSYSYVSRNSLSSSSGYKTSVNWTTDSKCISPSGSFRGLVGVSSIVFNDSSAAARYYTYDRNVYMSDDEYVDTGIHPNVLNGKDWLDINGKGHESIRDSVLSGYGSDTSFNDSNVQTIIKEYTEEVRSSLEYIEQEQTEQSHFLKGIYELLKEWLPKLFNKDTNVDVEIENSMNGFEDNSNVQSGQLGELVQDTQVEKPDIDSTSDLVDSNIDLEAVGEYGLLLSGLTSNQYVIRFILIALSIALVSYIFFGKR